MNHKPTFSEAYFGKDDSLLPYGSNAIHPDDTETRMSRWWLVLPLLILLAGVLVAVWGTAPRGQVRALPQMNEGGFR